jgi:NAD(P)H-hydrate repair Nnr-like enzyme with NAD(P)H-hydrate dehydratase domain
MKTLIAAVANGLVLTFVLAAAAAHHSLADYMAQLMLRRAAASRRSGEWNEDDYDVIADGVAVGRIFKANAAPVVAFRAGTPDIRRSGDRT